MAALLILVGLISFYLGRFSVGSSPSGELIIESTPIEVGRVVEALERAAVVVEEGTSKEPTEIVGNKKSKIYHLSSCSGAKTMSEENKVYFASITDAADAGFRPAENCPGLKEN